MFSDKIKNLILGMFLMSALCAINFSEDISPIIYNNCTDCAMTGLNKFEFLH